MKNFKTIATIALSVVLLATGGCKTMDTAKSLGSAAWQDTTNAFSSEKAPEASKEALAAATNFGKVVFDHAKEKGAKKSLRVVNSGNKAFNQYGYLPQMLSEMTVEKKTNFFAIAEAYAKNGDVRLMKGGKDYKTAQSFLKFLPELKASEGIVTAAPVKEVKQAKPVKKAGIDVSKLSQKEKNTLMKKVINNELGLSEEQNNALMADLLK